MKDTIKEVERQPTEREKVFADHISAKDLVPTVYKERLKLNNIKISNTIKKWSRQLKEQLLIQLKAEQTFPQRKYIDSQ